VNFSIANDNLIWQNLLTGDRNALAKLMQVFFRPLANYGLRFTSDKELIKDSVQELFIVLWERRDQLASSVNLKSYLFTSFRRLLLRKLKKIHKTSTITLDPIYVDSFSFVLGIDNKIIASEQAKSLSNHFNQLIAKLPERQREVVYLKFFEALSREEIANILEIAPQTVSNILQIALSKLKVATPESVWKLFAFPIVLLMFEYLFY
jgi:RNA polymerase sigma factor (sigma-70 family)